MTLQQQAHQMASDCIANGEWDAKDWHGCYYAMLRWLTARSDGRRLVNR